MKHTKLSIIIWNESISERKNSVVTPIYPDALHSIVAQALKRTRVVGTKAGTLEIATATLDQPEQGLGETRLETCDVLVWCGQRAHDTVSDDVVHRIHRRVLEGMGLVILHTGQSSKIFRRLLGVNDPLKMGACNEKELLCVVQPSHPIAAGLRGLSESPAGETYGTDFDGARPDATVLASLTKGGGAIASGCCWERGYGRLFYFRPGQIRQSTFQNANVQRILANAVQWVAPRFRFDIPNPVSTKHQSENMGNPFPARRIIDENTRPPLRQIESAPLFPTLMNHLQHGSARQEGQKTRNNDFRKTGVESGRLAKSA